jgi:hypothetical protein
MSNHRTRSIDGNLADFIERHAAISITASRQYKNSRETLPIETWRWRRDLMLMHQGAAMRLRGVMAITGVVCDLALLDQADVAIAHIIEWIWEYKLKPKRKEKSNARTTRTSNRSKPK